MKIVKYGFGGESFLLTDEEFKNAREFWSKGESCWCNRIEALLSPHILQVMTPRRHIGRKIFIHGHDLLKGNGYSEVFFEKGQWKTHDEWGRLDTLPFEDYKIKDPKFYDEWNKKILRELIPIDDFYTHGGVNAYLKAGSRKQFYQSAGKDDVEVKDPNFPSLKEKNDTKK